MVSFDPNRPDFSPYGLTCVRWTPTPMLRPDHHDEVEMNLLGSGHITYLLGGQKVRIDTGRLCVFWGAIPHQIIEISTREEYFVATIPFPWFMQFKLPDSYTQPLLHGEVLQEPPAVSGRSDYDLFGQWERDLSGRRDNAAEVAMLEMKARLMRMAARLPRDAAQRRRGNRGIAIHDGGLNKVERMAFLIARRYTERLTVDDISQGVDLHPNYAMSLFKHAFGTTLVEYLTHHRVSHAQRLLVTDDSKIVDIALASGFNSISRFNEAFRNRCGCSPREYRRRHALAG